MNRKERIEKRLSELFTSEISKSATAEVFDESHLHRGHAGARPEGETHYRIKLQMSPLNAQERLALHRHINKAMADEFESGLHALAIDIITDLSSNVKV